MAVACSRRWRCVAAAAACVAVGAAAACAGGGGGAGPTSSLKHDITLLGQLDNGLGFYRFSYNGSDKAYVGVMAQEVQRSCRMRSARPRRLSAGALRKARSEIPKLRPLDRIGRASPSRGALAALTCGNRPRDDVRSTSADRSDPPGAVVLRIGFKNIRRKRECARAARARPSWGRRQSKTRRAGTSTKSSRPLAQRDQPDQIPPRCGVAGPSSEGRSRPPHSAVQRVDHVSD